jgi:arylsulfatase
MRRVIRFATLLLALSATLAAADRPNIIVMMVDDMGWSDLGCYGSEIRTPHFDRLAGEGVRLTGFHNTSRCCPSRASILTGLYPHQTGLGQFVGTVDATSPGYQGAITRPCVTFAEVLGAAGYATCMSGKWHVGDPGPQQRGFQHNDAIFMGGAGSYFLQNPDKSWNPTFYATDHYADAVVRHIQAQAGRQPFVIYWAPTAPHWPLHAKAEDMAPYRGAYAAGPKVVAEARHRRQVELGLVRRDAPWTPPGDLDLPIEIKGRSPVMLDTEVVTRPWPKDRFGPTRPATSTTEPMEVYAGMIARLDQGLGRVLAALEAAGVSDDTLILFCSDNGACEEPAGLPRAWAAVASTPFLRYKKSAYEGGVATPCIIRWPKRTPAAQRGSINATTGHLVDIMATVADAGQAAIPATDVQGRSVPPCEGRSLLGVLSGEVVPMKAPVFIEHGGNCAVITQRWKLTSDHQEAWHLYDRDRDTYERTDLAAAHPEVVQDLATQWQAWADRVGAKRGGAVLPKNKSKGGNAGEG